MSNTSLWKTWFGRPPSFDPRFHHRRESVVNECHYLLSDPDYTKYDPYHAELAKKSYDKYCDLERRWKGVRLWPLFGSAKTQPKAEDYLVTPDEVALALFELYDFMDKINAAKEKVRKFE